MKRFLVVGVYAEDSQRWADSFEVKTPEEAEQLAPVGVIVAAVLACATDAQTEAIEVLA